jgi:hypothetical protein
MTTEKDLQTVIDLTVEHFKEWFPVRPTLYLKELKRNGRANWKTSKISVPLWAVKIGEHYAMYYALHELTHYYNGFLSGHGPLFQSIEDKLLSLWSMSIERAKAYPKRLYANGEEKPTLKKHSA